MPQLQLHKVYVHGSEHQRVLRAMYAEDRNFLEAFDKNVGRALDLVVQEIIAGISTLSNMYKVEMVDGTLAGYFITNFVGGRNSKFLRVRFRQKDIEVLFEELILLTNNK